MHQKILASSLILLIANVCVAGSVHNEIRNSDEFVGVSASSFQFPIANTENIEVTGILNTESILGNTKKSTTMTGVVNIDIINQTIAANTYNLSTSLCVMTSPTSCTTTQYKIVVVSGGQYKNSFRPTLVKKFTIAGKYPTKLTLTVAKVGTNQVYTYVTNGVLRIS